MTLAEIRGQDAAIERLRRALHAGRLGHALVFAGPSGVGKNTTAFALARALLCQVRPGEGCDRCAECHLVTAGTHPDLFVEDLNAKDGTAKVNPELVRLSREQDRFARSAAQRPSRGGRRPRGVRGPSRVDVLERLDAEGLLPDLQKKFGDFVIPVVLAHEWGHAMQQRSGFFSANQLTVSSELQADCFAGGWSKHAQKRGAFRGTSAQLDSALAGILDLRDQPGSSATDQSAHGSGFDRVSAFLEAISLVTDLDVAEGADGSARVRVAPASDPASGSVRPNAASFSPDASCGSHSCFCASSPNR